jgi:hypothetical protein
MADVTDPNAAPTHLDVRDRFSSLQVTVAAVAGVVATIVGIVLGLTLVNN